MNITISKNELNSALQSVMHAVSSSSPQPYLRGIRITANEDNLVLTGSNADISIQITMQKNENNDLNVIEEGSILIDGKVLTEIVRKLDSENISIEVIDGALTKLSGNSALFRINGMNPSEYPDIDFSKPPVSFTLKSAEFMNIIDQTVFASAAKDTRPVLTGVNFRLANGVMTVTSTDSFRLSKKTVNIDSSESFNITVPSRSLNDLKSTVLTDPNGTVEISLNSRKAEFITDGIIFQTKLLDGSYPETDRLIPKEFSRELMINRMDLIRAIDRNAFIRTENQAINRLQCSENEIVLTNRSQEIGDSQEVLSADYIGEELDISFSAQYVIEACRAVNSENIRIRFTGEMKPFIITDPSDENLIELVLPVRTYN